MDVVGALLGAFLAFLARSGALLGCLLGFMGASDLILGGFGEGLGGIWRGFGEGFAKVLEDFGKIYFDFLHWDPRAVSLRPAERHNLVLAKSHWGTLKCVATHEVSSAPQIAFGHATTCSRQQGE